MNTTHLFLESDKPNGSNKKLAIDRTVFAFERTALAYLRTGATFLIAVITLIKFFDSDWMKFLGFILIPPTLYLFFLGLQKFQEINAFLKQMKDSSTG